MWVVWWALLFWLWLLIVGEWNRTEIVAAALAAAIAGALLEVARSRSPGRARVPVSWVAKSATVPLIVVADFGVLTWALLASALRRDVQRGIFRTRPFASRNDDASRGTRAWVAMAATYSPNAYVIDFDADRVLLHDLIPWRRSESPA